MSHFKPFAALVVSFEMITLLLSTQNFKGMKNLRRSWIGFNKNQLIEKCHEMYHHDMLQGYTFALNNECTCGLWTYGLATCLCGNTPIFYNHKKIIF